MRNIGYILMGVGLIAMLCAMSMDVSVSTYAGRVNNIGLMAERQNYLIFSGFIFIGGVILAIFGSKSDTVSGSGNVKCEYCAELIKSDAVICKHCGKDVPEHCDDTEVNKYSTLPDQVDEEFSFRRWTAAEFIIRDESGLRLNKDAVMHFVHEMKLSRPGKTDSDLVKFYKNGIDSIKRGLPEKVRTEFEIDFATKMDHKKE